MRTLLTGAAIAALLTTAPAQAQFREALPAAPAPQTNASEASGGSGGGGLLGGVFGCSADGNKQGLAAVIGGAAGAFLGNRIAGSGSRTLGTLLGGALGAAAGSAVGCKLQKNDRDKAEQAARRAIETGQSQSWSNAETGASGRIDVADTASAATLADLRFAEGVEPASSFARVADSYTARSAVNIRAAPSTSSAVRGTLPAGQRVWVPAQVKGQPWLLVSENGVAQGYVSAPLLTRASTADCKLVTQSVSVPGEAEQAETYQACKGRDGAWTMTRV